MYTQCPECLTIYKIAADSLQASHGRFRCGHCGGVFDALPTLTEKLPDGIVDELPRVPAAEVPTVLSVPALRPVRQATLFADDDVNMGSIDIDLDNASKTRKEPTLPADWVVYRPGDGAPTPVAKLGANAGGRENRYTAPEAKTEPKAEVRGGRAQYDLGSAPAKLTPGKPLPAKPAPVVATPKFSAEPRPYVAVHAVNTLPARWPWIITAVLLSFGLLAQLGFYQRRALLAHDDFRPWLEQACALLHCKLPLREDLTRFKVLESAVTPHPRVKGALMISVSLINEAPFAQNFPVVAVQLHDTSARPVALRRFAPSSYLRDPSAVNTGIAANASLPIVFEVIDPGSKASGFEFSFLSGPYLQGELP
jgi:predicted Zn finger-like uncharacterized protein